jgi:Type I phosphodiesterase / nucleotide pyrophosphatase
MLAGRPVVYSTFLAYDEVAHHSGIERPETLEVLRRVDRQIARVAKAIPDAPRPYRLIVLSDHGQSQGATFLQRYGQTLEDVVRAACETEDVEAAGSGNESLAYLDAGVSEIATQDTAAGRVARGAARRRELPAGDDDDVPDLVVMASGNLASIVFPHEPGRVTLERLEELHPQLVSALREHPGVGFVLVRSEREGAVVLGATGANWLDAGRVEGDDPLVPFGPNAADHVRRTDAYPHCPDIVLNSTWWDDAGEVAAFEELVGSHGGMGGPQGFPFVLFPADLEYPDEEVVGPDSMHRLLRRWLAALGHEAYADGGRSSDSPG